MVNSKKMPTPSHLFSFFFFLQNKKKAKKSKADYLKNLLTKARKRNE